MQDKDILPQITKRESYYTVSMTLRHKNKNIYLANSKNNYNTNIMSKHRGGFPEGQSPIVMDTLSNAGYNIKYKKQFSTIYYRSTLMNIHLCTNVIKNKRSHQRQGCNTIAPTHRKNRGKFHQLLLLLSCAKSHMLSASRRQPHLLHVSAVDRRQTWSMDKS